MSFPNEAGNVILWLQGALGFVALLVMVERMVFFQHARTRVADLLLGITNHVRKKALGPVRFWPPPTTGETQNSLFMAGAQKLS